MYISYNASKAIHEARIRELLESAPSNQPGGFARLRRRLIAPREQSLAPAHVEYAARSSKSVEQTS
jgi:hypothetical protein